MGKRSTRLHVCTGRRQRQDLGADATKSVRPTTRTMLIKKKLPEEINDFTYMVMELWTCES